jgi:predicted aminopeptidase
VLGLPDNKSYRTYSDIGRSYVVWNVVAAPELSVTPVHWCFPVVGCVAYRGYFKEKSARDFGAHLRARGFDVVVEPVPAYSTLGRFADPVLNTMIEYGDTELAAIIFHELAHQLLYVAGDSSFNEAFATTVEEQGLKRWLISRGQLEELRRYEASRVRQLQYLTLFRRTRAQLASLYASKVPADTMRERKHALLEQLAKDMRSLEQSQHRRSGYDDWLEQGLNNAHLASLATYYDCVPGFERMLQEQNGDLERFYAAVRELSHQPKAQRDAAVCTAAPAPGTTRADRTQASADRA